MAQQIPDWNRHYFRPGGGDSLIHLVVFGDVNPKAPFSRERYRCQTDADGLTEYKLEDLAGFWFDEPFWGFMTRDDPGFGARIKRTSRNCVELLRIFSDPPTLNYLRDSVGIATFFLDHGGSAVLDTQILKLWKPEEWRERIFDPAAPVPRQHVVVLHSEDEQNPGTEWFHTRGMRKFGRPDLSVRGVNPEMREGVIDLCNRFIEFQAFGGIIDEGQEIRMASLPSGGICRHGGDLDDPDFNNVHVDVAWRQRSGGRDNYRDE